METLTLTVDTDSNTVMLASGQTITGGAGFDALVIQGSGIAAAANYRHRGTDF